MKQLLFIAVLAGCLAAPQTVAQTQNRVEHKVVKTNQTTIRDNSKPKSVSTFRRSSIVRFENFFIMRKLVLIRYLSGVDN